MKLKIHDVEHGLCISFIHNNGNVMLWDCGHKEGYKPSEFLRMDEITTIQYFFITNFDQDHLSDLPNLRANLIIRSIYKNGTISPDQLRSLKLYSGPLTEAMESTIDLLQKYSGGPLQPPPQFPGVNWKVFYNKYGNTFNDTNNISLVTFLEINSCVFLIPGDLELMGWRELLSRDDFRNELSKVTYMVASHHGRENGFCRDIFEFCKPKAIICSDGPIKYATQEMINTYAQYCSGISFNGKPRKVLSTRRDGTITWNKL